MGNKVNKKMIIIQQDVISHPIIDKRSTRRNVTIISPRRYDNIIKFLYYKNITDKDIHNKLLLSCDYLIVKTKLYKRTLTLFDYFNVLLIPIYIYYYLNENDIKKKDMYINILEDVFCKYNKVVLFDESKDIIKIIRESQRLFIEKLIKIIHRINIANDNKYRTYIEKYRKKIVEIQSLAISKLNCYYTDYLFQQNKKITLQTFVEMQKIFKELREEIINNLNDEFMNVLVYTYHYL